MTLCVQAADGSVMATRLIDMEQRDGLSTVNCKVDGMPAENAFQVGEAFDDHFIPRRAFQFDQERKELIEIALPRIECVYFGWDSSEED